MLHARRCLPGRAQEYDTVGTLLGRLPRTHGSSTENACTLASRSSRMKNSTSAGRRRDSVLSHDGPLLRHLTYELREVSLATFTHRHARVVCVVINYTRSLSSATALLILHHLRPSSHCPCVGFVGGQTLTFVRSCPTETNAVALLVFFRCFGEPLFSVVSIPLPPERVSQPSQR